MIAGSSPKKETGLRLGVSPLSWVNEVLQDFGKDTTADTCLREAAAAGYQGVEMSRIFPHNSDQLSKLLSGHGLQFVSGWHSGFLTDREVEAELDDVRDHAELLAACGADVMVYGECGHMVDDALAVPMSRRLRLKDNEFKAYGERLTHFSSALKSRYGLSLAYHHHLMMVAETIVEIEAVMAATGPEVGLLLDTGHAVASGFDYAQLIENFGSRINHIHLKDVRESVLADVRTHDLSFNDAVRSGVFTVPGDGMVDFGPLADFVAESQYSGWLVVEAEQDPKLAPPAEVVARAHRFVTANILNSVSKESAHSR